MDPVTVPPQTRGAEKTRPVARQTALGKAGRVEALEAKNGLLTTLEQEQGDEFLPGGGCFGYEEDAVAIEDVFAGEGEGFQTGITVGMQVLIQLVEDEGHATGLAEQAVELLAATDGIGGGQVGPFGFGGELPEDAVEQEAVGVGGEARAADEDSVEFLVQAIEEGLDTKPVSVVEEGDGGRGQAVEGGEGLRIFKGDGNE